MSFISTENLDSNESLNNSDQNPNQQNEIDSDEFADSKETLPPVRR